MTLLIGNEVRRRKTDDRGQRTEKAGSHSNVIPAEAGIYAGDSRLNLSPKVFIGEISGMTAFTLVEVILSVAITTAGLIFITQALGREINAVSLADDKIESAMFLREKLEEVKKELEEAEEIAPMSQSGHIIQNGKRYDWQIDVSENSLLKNLYEIKLVCMWEKFAKDNTSTLAAYVYK